MNCRSRAVASSYRSAISATRPRPSPNRLRLSSATPRSSRLRSVAVSAPLARSRAAAPNASMRVSISWIVSDWREASTVSRESVPVISSAPVESCSTALAISWLRD